MRTQPTKSEENVKNLRKDSELSESELVVEDLKKSVADLYMLQLKTQNAHWNVEGPSFYSMHILFEKQYKEMVELVDRTAENIRSMKKRTPGSFAEFSKLSSIQENDSHKFSAAHFVEVLAQDHANMSTAFKARREHAEEAEEVSAIVLYEDLISFHDKAAWMIRSHKGL